MRTSLRLSGLPKWLRRCRTSTSRSSPAVQRSKLEGLATCAWLREKQGLLILGVDPESGKHI